MAAASIAAGVTTASAEQWFCEASSSTGYIYGRLDGDAASDWHRANLGAEGRYVISLVEEVGYFAVVTRLGDNEPFIECTLGSPDTILCVRTLANFTFNTETMRYVMTYMAGFLDAQDDVAGGGGPTGNLNTTRIEIGECAPF